MTILELTLVLGGARSGKSQQGEALVMANAPPWFYVATAEAHDEEMRRRIADHRARRGGEWRTIDAPLELAAALREVPPAAPVLVDCLTLWLSNLMLAERDVEAASAELVDALAKRLGPSVVISNEVGLGIVPDNPLARAFRDAQGRLNQRLAGEAAHVLMMVAGIAMVVKQGT